MFRLRFKNCGERNSNFGLVEIGTITLRHTEERVSIRKIGVVVHQTIQQQQQQKKDKKTALVYQYARRRRVSI